MDDAIEGSNSEDLRAPPQPTRKSSKRDRNSSKSRSSKASRSGSKRSKSSSGAGLSSGISKSKSSSKSRVVVSIPLKGSKKSGGSSSRRRAGGSSRRPSSSRANGDAGNGNSNSGGGGSSRHRRKASKKGGDADMEDTGASSGEEYTTDLFNTYIGQVGGCVAMGLTAGDVLSLDAWNNLTEEDRESLREFLPQNLSHSQQEEAVERVLSGERLNFGSPRNRAYDSIAAGLTHPRVRRWQQRVSLIERREHLMELKDHRNRYVRRLQAWKACRESSVDILAGLAAIGGDIAKPGGPLMARPELIDITAEAIVEAGINDWDFDRWKRVLDFRNQEAERYSKPERAYTFRNPWGTSIVGPLKRGPALDGGRPREHPMLRNDRPSHVTILCIVRDAASRLENSRGIRSDICELLKDSQYLREGATYSQLNLCVSGALDRLHYENNPPVIFDSETKEWCYLHNDLKEDDFAEPDWVKEKRSKKNNSKNQ